MLVQSAKCSLIDTSGYCILLKTLSNAANCRWLKAVRVRRRFSVDRCFELRSARSVDEIKYLGITLCSVAFRNYHKQNFYDQDRSGRQKVATLPFPLQNEDRRPKNYIAQYEELGFSYPLRLKDDYWTKSHYLIVIHFSLKGWYNLGVKG